MGCSSLHCLERGFKPLPNLAGQKRQLVRKMAAVSTVLKIEGIDSHLGKNGDRTVPFNIYGSRRTQWRIAIKRKWNRCSHNLSTMQWCEIGTFFDTYCTCRRSNRDHKWTLDSNILCAELRLSHWALHTDSTDFWLCVHPQTYNHFCRVARSIRILIHLLTVSSCYWSELERFMIFHDSPPSICML